MRAGLLLGAIIILITTGVNAQVSGEADFKKKFGVLDGYLYDGDYYKALPLAKELYAYDSTNANLAYMLGTAYLGADPDRNKAIHYLEQAIMNSAPSPMYKEGDPKERGASGLAYYNLAKAYHFTYRFDDAISNYYNYRSFVDLEDAKIYSEVKRQIEYSENAKLLIEQPVNIKVQSLGPVINTKYEEYSPVISGDGNTLIFTSRREGSTGGKLFADGKFYEDIYIAKKERGKWITPRSIGVNINTEGHEATIGLSPDGQQLFIYKDDNGDGNVYVSKLVGEEWSKPEKLGGDINTSAWETHATVSSDGQNLFFVSNRNGGLGGRDIYKVSLLPDGTWSGAENLGSTINTQFDEEAPFFAADGRTLIFSSQGHNSMGGFDIFTSENIDGVWSTPENIGYPINSPEDDVFFVTTPDGQYAYYSSRMEGGMGEKDIYLIELEFKKKESLTVMKGRIIIDRGAEINANIVVTDTRTGATTGIYKPNKKTGSYIFILQPGSEYNVMYECEGYETKNDKIVVPENSSYSEITKAVVLDPVAFGVQPIVQEEEKKTEEVAVIEEKKAEEIVQVEEKKTEEVAVVEEKKIEELAVVEEKKTEEVAVVEEKKTEEVAVVEEMKTEEKIEPENKLEDEVRALEQQLLEQEKAVKAEEEARIAAAKAAEEKRIAEQKRIEEEQRVAEAAKTAEEKRLAEHAAAMSKAAEEDARLAAEKKKQEELKASEAKAAEEKRLAEVSAAKAKAEEEARIAAEKKKQEELKAAEAAAVKAKAEEEARIAAEKKIKEEEEKQMAQQKKKVFEDSLVARKNEIMKRLEALKKMQSQASVGGTSIKETEEARIAIEKKKEEDRKAAEAKLAEDKRAAQDAANKARLEEIKKADEKEAEEKRIAEEKKIAEAAAVKANAAEAARLAEEKRIAEEIASKAAQEKKKEEDRVAAEAKRVGEEAAAKAAQEKKKEEELVVAEAKRVSEEAAAKAAEAARIAEEKRKEEARLAAEAKRVAEEAAAKTAEAARIAEEKRKEEARIAAEAKRKAEETAAKAKAEEEARKQVEALANAISIDELKKMNQALIGENEQLKKQIAESNKKIDQLSEKVNQQNKNYEDLLDKFNQIQKQQNYQKAVEKTDFESFKKGEAVILKNIFFDYNLAIIKKESEEELQKLFIFMRDNKNVKVEVSGHTDSHGNDEYNIQLSRERANAVVRYITRHGIDANRLKSVGVGETQPIAINENPDGSDNPEGRQLNRRIEIKILNPEVKNIKVEDIVVPKDLKPKSN